jgi:hypothetical protein
MRKFFIIISLTCTTAGAIYGQKYVPVSFTQPPPLAAAAGNDSIVCMGHQVILGAAPTATGGSGSYIYMWSPPDGLDDPTTANPVLVPTESRLYMLSVTDEQGCQAVSFVNIFVDPCTGIDYKNLNASLTVFPNPSRGSITIRGISSYSGQIKGLSIINQLGQIIYEQAIPSGSSDESIHIDTGIQTPGMYFLKVRFTDSVVSQRLIVE